MGGKKSNSFDIERHRSAISLQPEHVADFQRLVKALRSGSEFQFLVADCEDQLYRDALITSIDNVMAVANMTCGHYHLQGLQTRSSLSFRSLKRI